MAGSSFVCADPEYSYKRAGCSVGPFAEKKDGYESFSVRERPFDSAWDNTDS